MELKLTAFSDMIMNSARGLAETAKKRTKFGTVGSQGESRFQFSASASGERVRNGQQGAHHSLKAIAMK